MKWHETSWVSPHAKWFITFNNHGFLVSPLTSKWPDLWLPNGDSPHHLAGAVGQGHHVGRFEVSITDVVSAREGREVGGSLIGMSGWPRNPHGSLWMVSSCGLVCVNVKFWYSLLILKLVSFQFYWMGFWGSGIFYKIIPEHKEG